MIEVRFRPTEVPNVFYDIVKMLVKNGVRNFHTHPQDKESFHEIIDNDGKEFI